MVVTELAWGVFADYCRIASPHDRDQILLDLRNRLILQIMRDSGLGRHDRVDSRIWLEAEQLKASPLLEYRQAIHYMGSGLSRSEQALSWYVVNTGPERPSNVPYIMDAARLVSGMSNDLIRGGQLYVS
jgi:hypothetical protein